MKRLMRFLMISCQKAGVLIEKKLSGKISNVEKFELAFHTSMCNACRNYEKQSKLMDEVLKSEGNAEKIEASEDFKMKLKENFE